MGSGSLLPRFDKLPAEKRGRILAVAAEEFTERGYGKASLNRIIERAGISKGSMYYYFHDKAHLYVAVLEHAFEVLMREHPLPDFKTSTAKAFWQELESYTLQAFDYAREHPDLVRLIRTTHALRYEKDAPSLEQLRSIGRDWAREIFVCGQQAGAIRTDLPIELMLAIWTSVDSVGDAWIFEHWDDSNDEQRRRNAHVMIDLFRRMWTA
jgi:AcrR family transcriptional regulator